MQLKSFRTCPETESKEGSFFLELESLATICFQLMKCCFVVFCIVFVESAFHAYQRKYSTHNPLRPTLNLNNSEFVPIHTNAQLKSDPSWWGAPCFVVGKYY